MTEEQDKENARKSSIAGLTFVLLEEAHLRGTQPEKVAEMLGEIVSILFKAPTPVKGLATEAYRGEVEGKEFADRPLLKLAM